MGCLINGSWGGGLILKKGGGGGNVVFLMKDTKIPGNTEKIPSLISDRGKCLFKNKCIFMLCTNKIYLFMASPILMTE